MMNLKNKVVFYQIKNVKTKLIKIIQTAMLHFERKEKLLIQVSDEASLNYVDQLLWKVPIESFLPHRVSDKPIDDFIVITKAQENLNKAPYLFNLSGDIIDLDTSYKIIYDFDDFTSPKKQEKSKKRFEIYRAAGFKIESN
ncbi:MAG: DNA polymerase III subunit chi [Candidatus Anoxychlamydiales bacterium]|nr:DNA polymerase III subunit chi [Candidatus Anoxychlamydiales bacterium]